MWPNQQETADFVTFAEEILNEKLHFWCSAFASAYYFNHSHVGSSWDFLLQELLAISFSAIHNSSEIFWKHHRDALNIYWSVKIWHK